MATYFGARPYTAFSGINSEYYVSREQAAYAYDAPSASQTHSSISSPALSEGDPTPPREASPAAEATVSTGYGHARPLVRQETLPPRFARKNRSLYEENATRFHEENATRFHEENVHRESAPVPSIFDMLVNAANAEVDETQNLPPAMESASAANTSSSMHDVDDSHVMVDNETSYNMHNDLDTHSDDIPHSYNNTPDTDIAMLSESDDEDADDDFAMVESEDDDEDEEYEEPARKRAKRSPAGKSGKKSPAGKKSTSSAKSPPAKKTPAKKDSPAKTSPPAKKSPPAETSPPAKKSPPAKSASARTSPRASPPMPSSASTRKSPPAKKTPPAKNTSASTKKSPPKKTASRSKKSTSTTNSDADADPEMTYAEMVANIGSIKTLPWTTEGVKAFVTRFIKRSEARRAAVARKAAEAKQKKIEEAAEAAAKKAAEAAKKAAGEEVVEEEGKGQEGKGKKGQGKKAPTPTTTGKRKRGPVIELIDEDNDLDEYELDDDEDSDCHCHASSSSSSSSSSTSTPTTPCTCGPSSKKTCHALSQRIELLRTDPTLTSFGAHHAMCAGCGAQIRTDIRWEFYYKALWGKHSLEKCAGLRKWEESPPSAAQMEAWQKSRDASAEDAKVYFTMMADKGASDCVCKELGREVEIIRKYEADKAVRDAKKAQKEADAKEKKDVETEEPEDEDSEERAATPIPARPTRRLPKRAAARK